MWHLQKNEQSSSRIPTVLKKSRAPTNQAVGGWWAATLSVSHRQMGPTSVSVDRMQANGREGMEVWPAVMPADACKTNGESDRGGFFPVVREVARAWQCRGCDQFECPLSVSRVAQSGTWRRGRGGATCLTSEAAVHVPDDRSSCTIWRDGVLGGAMRRLSGALSTALHCNSHAFGAAQSTGEVLPETSEKRRRRGAKWRRARESTTVEGACGKGRCNGPCQVSMSTQRVATLCNLVARRALRPRIEARLAGVAGANASTDAFRAHPRIMESLGATHNAVNHSQHFHDSVGGTHTDSVEGVHGDKKKETAACTGSKIEPTDSTAFDHVHASAFVARRAVCRCRTVHCASQ